jgi:hypothetical protein
VQTGTSLVPSSVDAMTVAAGSVTLESSSTLLLGRLNLITGAADLRVDNFADLFLGSTSRALRVDVGDLLEVAEFGRVTIRSGADVNASLLRVGRGDGYSASLAVTGGGSSLTISSPTVVSHIGGDGGSGSLAVENSAAATLGPAQILKGGMFAISGGDITIDSLTVGRIVSGDPPNSAELTVSGAGSTVTQSDGILEVTPSGRVDVDDSGVVNTSAFLTRLTGGVIAVGPGGTFNANGGLLTFDAGRVAIAGGTFNANDDINVFDGEISVHSGAFNANADLFVNAGGLVDVDGGMLNSNLARASGGGKIFVHSGKLDATLLIVDGAGSRLILDGGEFETGQLILTNGGQFDWKSGALTLPSGTFSAPSAVPFGGTLNTAREGAVTINGPFVQSLNSTVNTQGSTTLGSPSAVNGFASQGTLTVGSHTVTLRDANDAVFDSGALVTLGAAANEGTLVAANGITLNFGGNIIGFGVVNTPNDPFSPLINNGHIAGTSAAQPITLPGYVKGVGALDHVMITGTDAPGFSPATVYRGSVNYAGALEIELAGAAAGQFDAIRHLGVATLGGTLDVSLLGGFMPAIGDMFEIISADNGVTGQFATTAAELPALAGGKRWLIDYQLTSVVLEVLPPFGADFDEDGDVDGHDLVEWRTGFGTSGTASHIQGDADGDQDVDGVDFLILQRQLGSPASVAATAAIPEPAALTLVVSPALARFLRRRIAMS